MALVCVACEQHDEPTSGAGTTIDVVVAVDDAQSRAMVVGKEFANGQTYGLFVCESGTYAPHNIGYNNMRAVCSVKDNVSSWSYNYEGGSFTFSSLFIISNDANTNADFYAYAPWLSGVKDPTAISFTLGTNNASQPDMMYAEQNANEDDPDDLTDNKGILPNNIEQTVTFRFRHVLSCLQFGFRLRSASMPMSLRHIRLRTVEGGAPLYNKATMNALAVSPETALSNQQEATAFTVSDYNLAVNATATYQTAPLLIIPSDASAVAEGESVYRIEMTFNNAQYPFVFDIPREAILHGDGTTVGFLPGYTYTFNFTIDNYLHLDGITIDNVWKQGEDVDIVI